MNDEINPDQTARVIKKWYKRLILFGPVLGTLVGMMITGALWLDTRYMHKEISDLRHIDTQMLLLEMRIEMYGKIEEAGGTLSVNEKIKYDMYKDQLKEIMKVRQEIMDIGDDQ